MKLSRLFVASLAVIALLSGCGSSSNPTNVSPSLDNAPPATPSSLRLLDEGGTRTMVWAASSAPDLAGYDIYVYSPSPTRDNSYVMLASTEGSGTSFTIPSMWADDGNYLRVVAVDESGNHSGMSSPLLVAKSVGGTGLPLGFDKTDPIMKRP